MITVAGVAFSIVIVALTLASSQFGPRLLRNFMKDRVNQFVLGSFVATFIYCLLVMRTIQPGEDTSFVPGISVIVAVLSALFNVGVLIYFIHHVSTTIQADHVVAVVYSDLTTQLNKQFPDAATGSEDDPAEEKPQATSSQHALELPSPAGGYLRAVDWNGLVKAAREHSLVLRVLHYPGKLVVERQCLAYIDGAQELDEESVRRLAGCFIIGSQRSPAQDPEYGVDQLVEVALRALSPGINDPFTAIACVDKLSLALCMLAGRRFPPAHHHDEEGTLRVIARTATFASILDAAFDQIRQYSRDSVAVMIRQMEALTLIARHTRTRQQATAVMRQAKMILAGCSDVFPVKGDREDLQRRYDELAEVLSGMLDLD